MIETGVNKIFTHHPLRITKLCVFTFLFLFFYLGHAQAEAKPSVLTGEKLYKHYCTPCHGIKGNGRGFNAENLDPRPANHTDSRFMSKRSDKDLYDVIKGGGRAVGKATLMPPWGGNLDDTQIRSLVLYLRRLCMCKHE